MGRHHVHPEAQIRGSGQPSGHVLSSLGDVPNQGRRSFVATHVGSHHGFRKPLRQKNGNASWNLSAVTDPYRWSVCDACS